jgi:hypothetical protein
MDGGETEVLEPPVRVLYADITEGVYYFPLDKKV